MKILVATKVLDLDRTSEGICAAKFLWCLVKAGLEVVCLAPARAITAQALRYHGTWVSRIKLKPLEDPSSTPEDSLGNNGEQVTSIQTGCRRYFLQKAKALVAYATGFPPETWSEVGEWRKGLRRTIVAEQPDVAFIRGAGAGFEPHLAMAGLAGSLPWVANYHDPFPLSLYPEPYRQRQFLLSAAQERWNAHILSRASRITFPSGRLLAWMLRGDLATFQDKAVVLPHACGELPGATYGEESCPVSIRSDRFVLIHAGTLLGPREPWGLVEGFRRFIAKSPERRELAELLLVGSANKRLKSDPRWVEAKTTPGVRILEQRVSYACSLDLLRRASVAIVLEADQSESPFFPAKLVDCLLYQKPVLALSPRESVVSDLLGQDYPYRCQPSAAASIASILEHLWTLWREARLGEAATSRHLTEQLSMDAIGARCHALFRQCAGRASEAGQLPAVA